MNKNKIIKMDDNLLSQKQSGLIYTIYVTAIIFINLIFQVVIMAIASSKINGTDIAISEAIASLTATNAYKFTAFSLSSLSAVLVTLYVVFVVKKPILKVASISKFNKQYILLGFAIFFIMFFGLSYANEYFIKFLQKYCGYNYQEVVLPTYSPTNYILTVLFICILPAVFEEVVFRGLLLNPFKNGNQLLVCIINGGMFAIYHMNPAQTPYQFLTGFLFAMLAIKSSSIILPIIIHFLNNFIIVTAYYFFDGGVKFLLAVNIALLIISLLLLVGIICKLFFNEKNNVQSKIIEFKQFFIYSGIGIAVCLSMWVAGLL